MEFESPISPYRAIKKAMNFFEKKVNNTKVKEAPASRRDPMILEVGITTIWGEIFWTRINTRRSKDKQSSKVFVKSRPGTRHMFFSAIVLLLSGPFFYMALSNDIRYFTLIMAAFFALIGIASMIMPVVRINRINKQIKEVLSKDDDQFDDEESDKEEIKVISSRLELQ